MVDTTTFIDYATSDGKKIYRNAIESLPIKYDLDPGSTNTFNESLKDKCASTGWSDPNADVITVPNSDGKDINLIEGYGRLTMKEIRDHCSSYINLKTRQAQHQYQMYECIMNSLTQMTRLRITSATDKYEIGGVKCGPLLFKHLMMKAVVDKRATTSYIKENLADLDTYITTVDSNITIFNEYVKEQ